MVTIYALTIYTFRIYKISIYGKWIQLKDKITSIENEKRRKKKAKYPLS